MIEIDSKPQMLSETGVKTCEDCEKTPIDFQLYQFHGVLLCKWCAIRRNADVNTAPAYNLQIGEWD